MILDWQNFEDQEIHDKWLAPALTALGACAQPSHNLDSIQFNLNNCKKPLLGIVEFGCPYSAELFLLPS